MSFNKSQQDILLKGLNPSRVEKRKQAGMNLSYLSQHDVRAHLIRLFGFGGFDLTTDEADVVFQDESDGKWEVGCKVTMSLTVRDEYGNTVCTYSETAIGTSRQGRRGEALDMAMKTASSDAMKRACINLGDQFGLSLYNNGQTAPIVQATLVSAYEDAPVQPVEAPVSDEQPEPAEQDTETSAEAVEAAEELASYIDLPVRERIMAVAKWKAAHGDLHHRVLPIDGQNTTLARYADLVASGKYSEGDNK
jgi:hypothetical protein